MRPFAGSNERRVSPTRGAVHYRAYILIADDAGETGAIGVFAKRLKRCLGLALGHRWRDFEPNVRQLGDCPPAVSDCNATCTPCELRANGELAGAVASSASPSFGRSGAAVAGCAALEALGDDGPAVWTIGYIGGIEERAEIDMYELSKCWLAAG